MIEGKIIAPIVFWIPEFLIAEDVFKNDFRSFTNDFSHFNILVFDFSVDLLLFVGQEYIVVPVLLDKHLTNQDFQSLFDALLQGNTIRIDVGDHQAGNVIDICGDLFDVLDHEEGFQHINIEIICFIVRINVAVISCPRNNALVAMVQELMECIIKDIEGDQRTMLTIHKLHGRFLEQSDHGTFAFRQVFP